MAIYNLFFLKITRRWSNTTMWFSNNTHAFGFLCVRAIRLAQTQGFQGRKITLIDASHTHTHIKFEPDKWMLMSGNY